MPPSFLPSLFGVSLMASKSFFDVRALGREYVVIAGSFAPAGSGAPTAPEGKGFTVARTGTGIFLVTLDAGLVFPALVSGSTDLQLANAADSMAQLGTVDLAARTVVIRTLTAGSAADISANANNRIHFALIFRNSVVK